jgi:hypothetical protein
MKIFSPVKNNIVDAAQKYKDGVPAGSASTGEHDIYASNRRLLQVIGVKVAGGDDQGAAGGAAYAGIRVQEGAKVVLGPDFSMSVGALISHFPEPEKVPLACIGSRR